MLAIYEPTTAHISAMPRGPHTLISAHAVASYRRRFRARDRRAARAPWLSAARRLGPVGIALPLAAFSAVLLWDGGPPGLAAVGFTSTSASTQTGSGDREAARFTRCGGFARSTCVVDGDTIWYRGNKIRIADINTPELSDPGCASEAALAERATVRLTQLLNAGRFSLKPTDRDRDRYGRALRVITRNDASVGAVLVAEGLAERWTGHRREWC